MIEIRNAVTEWNEWVNDSIGYRKCSEKKLQYRVHLPEIDHMTGMVIHPEVIEWEDVPTVYLDENGEEIK